MSGANFCRLLALTGLSALLWAVPAAQAEPDTVTTLTGEELQFHFSGASLNCQDANNGTFTYHSDAIVQVAFGPYPGTPGTIQESGTLVFEDGLSKSFQATFTIDSAAGHVEGTKTLSFPDTTVCTTLGSGPGQVQQIQPIMQLRYEATITTAAGTLHDRGSVTAPMIANLSATGDTIGNMSESFASDRELNDLDLTPKESVNPPGTTHTVTALFRDAALVPQSGETILFTVSGSSAETGQCTTGSDGTCAFSYQGPDVPGSDVIEGCHDFDGDGTHDPGEKCDTATKAWGETASTGEGASGGGYFNNVNGNRVVFGFGAHGGPSTPSGSCHLIEQTADVTVRCLSVTLLLIAGTHATFQGEALVNGIATNYQIDVDDLGDPEAPADTFTIVTDAGYAASGVVEHGNIQVNSG